MQEETIIPAAPLRAKTWETASPIAQPPEGLKLLTALLLAAAAVVLLIEVAVACALAALAWEWWKLVVGP
jgi:hypothetical protein